VHAQYSAPPSTRPAAGSIGGTWRTLAGLADFAVVQSYLSTARKWGINSYDALTRLFTTGAWLPPAAAPC
jgi:transposase